jgi:drug/metabolite transporter (DMT)-like permease
MAVLVRLCDDYGGEVSSFQKSFFRNIIALMIAGGVFLGSRSRSDFSLTPKAWLTLIGRSIFGTIGIFANFYALSHIPVGEAMTLNKTAPFFTVIFSALIFKERISKRQMIFLMVAFLGASLVMKPSFRGDDLFAAMCAVTGGLGAGLAYVCVHALGRMKVNGALIVLFFSAFSSLASIPFMMADLCPMTFLQIIIMTLAGVSAAIGQFGITLAYRYAEPRSIAIYDYTNVIFTAILGWLMFSQVPDMISVVGFIAIVFAAWKM